jgi:hypothetical protein
LDEEGASAVRGLERAGVPRSTAMAMVGHRTEAIYRRYAIVDEVMLHEAAEKLAPGPKVSLRAGAKDYGTHAVSFGTLAVSFESSCDTKASRA